MPKDTVNIEGIEHREWHNLYGLYMQQATAYGLTSRTSTVSTSPAPLRPFVLSRAFWAGSQRHGAIWTGDNSAQWEHLKISFPMLLSINIAGLSFAGADVGGFFGDGNAELFTRWYQAGAFTPFFRGHAHHDTKRREPWVYGEPYTSTLRTVAMLRYSLLPYWYTVFYEAYCKGVPVMRTMFTEFPDDVSTFTLEDQWMVGDALLVKPVTDAGRNTAVVYFPQNNGGWYDLLTLQQVIVVRTAGEMLTVQAPLEKIPVFMRAGRIIPRKMRLRRSAKLMYYDPYTLVVVPDEGGGAVGYVYLDDEHSLAHEVLHGAYSLKRLEFIGSVLRCSGHRWQDQDQTSEVLSKSGVPLAMANTVERVVLVGQTRAPRKVVMGYVGLNGVVREEELGFTFDAVAKVVTVKKPNAKIIDDWTIAFEY